MNRKKSGIAVRHTGEPTVLWREPALGVLTSGVQPTPSGPWFLHVHMGVVGGEACLVRKTMTLSVYLKALTVG